MPRTSISGEARASSNASMSSMPGSVSMTTGSGERGRRAILTQERRHLAAIHVVRDGDDLEIFAVELAVQLRHVRELFATRVAPRRPEVHERHLAREPGERQRVPMYVREREGGSEGRALGARRVAEQRVGIERREPAARVHRDGGLAGPEVTGREDRAACRVEHVDAQPRGARVVRSEGVQPAVGPERQRHVDEGVAHADVAGVAPLGRSEEHTSELQSHVNLVCRLLLEKKKNIIYLLLSYKKKKKQKNNK